MAGLAVAVACSVSAVAGVAAGPTDAPRGWRVTVLPGAAHGASSFSEPGIAVGPHHTLIENACSANAGIPSLFWRSPDDGRTWSRAFTIGTSAIGCGDADAALGADGWTYSLNLGAGVDVYRSRDGQTWQGPASFPPPHGADQPDRPWLVLVPGHPNQVLVFNSEVGGNVVMWRSVDHARTFTGPTPVTGGANSEMALALGSRPLVDPTNPARMFMFYETVGSEALARDAGGEFPFSQLWEASTTDGGRTWDNSEVLDVTSAFGADNGSIGHLLPATAVDHAGNRYVVLSVRLGSASETHLYLLHSTERSWTKPARIDTGAPSNVFPALAVAAPGHVFISWYASDSPGFADPEARWFEQVASTTKGLSAHPSFRQVRLSTAPVHVGAIDNMGAIGNDVGQDWSLRDFQSIVVDSCGHPHVAWASDHHHEQTFAATTTPYC